MDFDDNRLKFFDSHLFDSDGDLNVEDDFNRSVSFLNPPVTTITLLTELSPPTDTSPIP